MHSEKGPSGRLVLLCLCSLSPGVLKGIQGKTCLSLCSLSPGAYVSRASGEGFYVFL